MTHSKPIIDFDLWSFDFFSDQLKWLGKEICEKFREKIVNNTFAFGLIDVLLEKMVYPMLPIITFCHCFYCWRCNKLVRKCDIYSRSFVDDNDISKKIDHKFIIIKSSLAHLPIYNMMDQVNTMWVVLNIYYLFGSYIEKKTENPGEIFYEVANSPFGLYMFYLKIYLRVYFNLLKPVTKAITDNYLSELQCSKERVSNVKRRFTNILVSNIPDTTRQKKIG